MTNKMMENLGFPASWTDDQVRYANNAINQYDILTSRVKVLENGLKQLALSESEAVRNHVNKLLESDNG